MGSYTWNTPVMDYFEALSQIPRGSGNEQAISDWLVRFAEDHGLEARQDAALNVLLRKAATPGWESAPAVMLQGHMDMVCEKVMGSDHDFFKDPIELVVEGEYLHANGTTLGADNGIGVAMILAVFTDPDLKHPALEGLITTNEEVGMLGAKALDVDLFQVKSKVLINLDTGIHEGVFVAGCAGGGGLVLRLPTVETATPDAPAWRVTVSGLKGGHSGAEIHLGRANALQVLGRVLYSLRSQVSLCRVEGGTKDNVIPRSATATVVCADGDALRNALREWQDTLQSEFGDVDSEITVTAEATGTVCRIWDADTQGRFLDLLTLLPCGVQAMDAALGCVATSANLGAAVCSEGHVSLHCSIRSSLPSHLTDLLIPRFHALAALCGASCEQHDFYPGWSFRPESRVRELALECYRELGSVVPRYMTLHGGLECGVLIDRLGEMDAISFAPELNSPHSPLEHVRIPSVALNYQVLRRIVERLG